MPTIFCSPDSISGPARFEGRTRAASFFLLILILSGCTSYRMVKVVTLKEDVQAGRAETYYGVTKNNILIPEYVLDETNRYPTSSDEAWRRFEARRARLEPFVKSKYKVPNSFAFQSERFLIGVGLVAVAPVAIPVHYLGGLERNASGRRDWGYTVKTYFDFSLNPVIVEEARVRDHLAAPE